MPQLPGALRIPEEPLREWRNAWKNLQVDASGLFEKLFEFSPDAIIVSDHEGRIRQVNAQVEKFFGYARSELLGQPIEILIPERFRTAHPKHRTDYAEHPRVRTMGAGLELYGRRKDGTEFPVDIMLGPVESTQGQLVLSVIRDLTEKRAAEEALQKSEREKHYLEEELVTIHQFEEIIGENSGLKRVLKQVEDVAATDATVLILGETGTGKELDRPRHPPVEPRAGITPSSNSTARPFPRAFSKVNCSATKREPLRERSPRRSDVWSWPIKEPFSWMK